MTMKSNYLNYFANVLNLGPEAANIMTALTEHMFPPRVLDEFQQKGWEKLGNGYYLAPLENLESNRDQYSNLYKGNEKLSDLVFRRGGIGGNWKGDYISLILYTKKRAPRTGKPPKPNEPKEVFDFGIHCIVDKEGNVVYKAEGISRYPYLCGGCLMTIDNVIRNLKTDSNIVKYDGTSLESDKFMFVNNKYNKEYPKGVYKIDYETGEFEIFDLTK